MNTHNIKNEKESRQLEMLSLELVADKLDYNLFIKNKELTNATNDGGYDAIIEISISEDVDIKHEILIESKLRRTVKTLAFDDCAKILIIAFNRAVHTVFIVTNISFAPQSIEQMDIFARKINLDIRRIDGSDLHKYIQQNIEKISLKYSNSFLELIKRCHYDIAPKSDKDSTEHEERNLIVQSATKKTPRIDDVFYITGLKEKCEICSQNIMLRQGALVIGNAGVGKSVFINCVFEKLKEYGYYPTAFDLQEYETPRLLFIALIQSLWGCNISSVCKENFKEDFRKIVMGYASEVIDDDSFSALLCAFSPSSLKDINVSSEYFYLLARYLQTILLPYQNDNKIVWAFQNLNKAKPETIHFLETVVIKLNNIIGIILELRPDTTYDNNTFENPEKFKAFYEIFPNPFIIKLAPFNKLDAVTFLKCKLPTNCPQNVILDIVEYIGTNPLDLSTVAKFLCSSSESGQLSLESLDKKRLNNYFETYRDSLYPSLLGSIKYWKQDKDFAMAFALTGLMNGKLPLPLLESIFSDRTEYICQKLDSLGLYDYDFEGYHITHNCLYDTMRDDTSPRMEYRLANHILDFIAKSNSSFVLPIEKKWELTVLALRYDEAIETWTELKDMLYSQKQYWALLQFKEAILTCFERSHYSDNEKMRMLILDDLARAYISIHIVGRTSGFENILDKYKEVIGLLEEDSIHYRCSYLFYKWTNAFYSGRIEDSYEIITEAMHLIECNAVEQSLCAEIWWAYALSHKRKTNIDTAIDDYRKACELFPEQPLPQIGLTLHKAHKFLRINPQKTYIMCADLLKKLSRCNCSYHETLQVEIDMTMALFYEKKYNEALIFGKECLAKARSFNASYQIGRLYNILGSCFYVAGEKNIAANYYKEAKLEWCESGNSIFSWRAEFNASHTTNEKGKNNMLHDLLRHGISNLLERLDELTIENAEIVAVLYAYRTLTHAKEVLNDIAVNKVVEHPRFKVYLQMDQNNFDMLLDNYNYMHNGALIILG